VRNVRLPHGTLDLQVMQSAGGGMKLQVVNRGEGASLMFDPQIPLGARSIRGQCGSRAVPVTVERHPQDEHAALRAAVPVGALECEIRYVGGVELVPDAPRLQVGDASRGPKITGVSLEEGTLTIHADAAEGETTGLELKTTEQVEGAEGARIEPISAGRYRVLFEPKAMAGGRHGYAHQTVRIRLKASEAKGE
jgi:hypothetical protein